MSRKFERGSEWRIWDLHVHTRASFDYKYKGEDAEEILVESWRANKIEAVAITDHFEIDKDTITRLRELAPEITIFPGIELRTDKGATNIHVILIFSEKMDLEDLANTYKYNLHNKAKAPNNPETIHWDFNDICTFAKENDALLSIHTGSKSSGMDQEISNALPINQAIKTGYAESVDIFEVSKKADIQGYENHVFKAIKERPVIICSDNHDPTSYNLKEKLWIKADLTFNGLKQAVFHSQERVYVGDAPPKIQYINKNKRVYIEKLEIKRKDGNLEKEKWFNADIKLNSGLITIIGNKGSGKSALSDIIGRMTSSQTMEHASFLNSDRFLDSSKDFGEQFYVKGKWLDGMETEKIQLDDQEYSSVPTAQYLPQKYIEKVCTDLGNEFQREINKVIYSYIDDIDRTESSNFDEFIDKKSKGIKYEINEWQQQLQDLNNRIIDLENLYDTNYQDELKKKHEKLLLEIERHEALKPGKVEKYDSNAPEETQIRRKIEELDKKINDLVQKERELTQQLISHNKIIDKISEALTKVRSITNKIEDTNTEVKDLLKEVEKEDYFVPIHFETPQEKYEELLREYKQTKEELFVEISQSNSNNIANQIDATRKEKDSLVNSSSEGEKKYQNYLKEMEIWEEEKRNLIGDIHTEDTQKYFEHRNNYIVEKLDNEYRELTDKRENIIRKIYREKQNLSEVYKSIYKPIDIELKKILLTIEDDISFTSEVKKTDEEFAPKILNEISKNYAGIFNGKDESIITLNSIIRKTNFDDENSVIDMVNKILEVITEDKGKSNKKVKNKSRFLEYLTSLEYLNVEYKLMMREKSLNELSPGERGLVLLVFYLTLDKNEMPIIIDQPEDNLDNQSVYAKLVPCIIEARKKRQVIIVTHNPNIGIACDSDQIIHCNINKVNNVITYETGSIEELIFTQKILEVLEGTKPAFNLRREKYNIAWT